MNDVISELNYTLTFLLSSILFIYVIEEHQRGENKKLVNE
jgi:hypothetical protein